MYELSVETRFTASHAVTVGGVPEQPHSHVWHVTATVAGDTLDADGLVCDFHAIEGALREIVGPFEEKDLANVPPFCDGVSQSAEMVAKHIGDRLAQTLVGGVWLVSLRVTEAPGCAATYRPERQR